MKIYMLLFSTAMLMSCDHRLGPVEILTAQEKCKSNNGISYLKVESHYYDVICKNGATFPTLPTSIIRKAQ